MGQSLVSGLVVLPAVPAYGAPLTIGPLGLQLDRRLLRTAPTLWHYI
jgi:hypothetical protein